MYMFHYILNGFYLFFSVWKLNRLFLVIISMGEHHTLAQLILQLGL